MNAFVGQRRLGVAIVGLGGAVATTAIAGIELLRLGLIDAAGLPLADVDPQLVADLVRYEDIVFRGWDLNDDNLYQAAHTHNVLTPVQLQQAGEELAQIEPWPAVGIMQSNLQQFRREAELDNVVVVNLASTERTTDTSLPLFATIDAFEAALDANAAEIGPALLYAYAAISAGVPYINFTPSVAADVPALIAPAEQNNVPIAGKDGKTSQTMMKTVIAPALRSRALRVDAGFPPIFWVIAMALRCATKTRSNRSLTPRARCWIKFWAITSKTTWSTFATTSHAATTKKRGTISM